jgi:hypothetical protein
MRTSHRLLWSGFVMLLAMPFCWVCTSTSALAQGAVTMSFSIPESTVSLHEPVYIQFSIHNGLNEGVRFDLGLAENTTSSLP